MDEEWDVNGGSSGVGRVAMALFQCGLTFGNHLFQTSLLMAEEMEIQGGRQLSWVSQGVSGRRVIQYLLLSTFLPLCLV